MSDSYQKHQRYILRRFPPFLEDAMIGNHEKLRLMFIVLWACFIVVPTRAHDRFCLGARIDIVCVGQKDIPSDGATGMRCIELATAPYKLKILGYYHRKIDHFLGQFPSSTSDEQVVRFYALRTSVLAILFLAGFVGFTTLLAYTDGDKYPQVMILYVLSVASVCVLFYLGKVYCIELPQVIVLRHRPEFAFDVLFSDMHDEHIPFAQPVSDYNTTREA
ncbi:hypothetical protein Ae201684P_020535 [Aphanomyces euteiches]|nr:hypothetical protein Ae201684P_020535 [Aphanomyces euteiches]